VAFDANDAQCCPDRSRGAVAENAGACPKRIGRQARDANRAARQIRRTIRITSVEHAAATILYPALRALLPDYPDIKVEITSAYELADIVTDRFAAGVRLGEDVDKDMISARIAPDLDIAIIGSPSYFKHHPAPDVPQDLMHHKCINLRLSPIPGFYNWDFEKDGRAVKVRVDGQLAFNTIDLILKAALDGFGLAHLPLNQVDTHIDSGNLVRVLKVRASRAARSAAPISRAALVRKVAR
jgi:DNA-binding transcriptional LysR family regulator